MFWDDTPIDLFFAYDAFHHAAAAGRHVVPFADTTIPILAAEHLVVCKAVFDRPKDWVDVDAIVAADTPIDVAEVLRWVGPHRRRRGPALRADHRHPDPSMTFPTSYNSRVGVAESRPARRSVPARSPV